MSGPGYNGPPSESRRLRQEAALKDKRIAELEAHAEHDEDNLEGLQHALVRANQRYTQAEAELVLRDKMLRLAILDGEHPAGMDADYLADIRRRALEETP